MNTNTPGYHGDGLPPKIISHAVWLCHRFSLAFRDAEDLLAERRIPVSCEPICCVLPTIAGFAPERLFLAAGLVRLTEDYPALVGR